MSLESLTEAASARGLNRRALAAAAVRGRVTGERQERQGVTAARYRFDPERLDADLAQLPRCSGGCGRPALSDGGRCGSCRPKAQGRPRNRRYVERDCAGCGEPMGEVPESQRYHSRACLSRARALEERWCEWCGKSLGLVSAAKIAAGGARFCSNSHHLKWEHAQGNIPAQPQSGETITCPGCGASRYRPPSHVGSTGGYCIVCFNQTTEARARIEANKRRLRDLEQGIGELRASGLRTTFEVADTYAVAQWTVLRWVAAGRLRAEVHKTRGGKVVLIAADALVDFERAWARSSSPHERRWLEDVDWVVEWHGASGLTRPVGGESVSQRRASVRRGAKERRSLVRRRRRGRHKSKLRATLPSIRAEVLAEAASNDERNLSDCEIARRVFVEAWRRGLGDSFGRSTHEQVLKNASKPRVRPGHVALRGVNAVGLIAPPGVGGRSRPRGHRGSPVPRDRQTGAARRSPPGTCS